MAAFQTQRQPESIWQKIVRECSDPWYTGLLDVYDDNWSLHGQNILSPTATMSDMRTGVQKNQVFSSLDAFKAYIREASIRQHWDLSVMRSNKKNVTLGCRSSSDCPFRVVCRTNKHYTYVTVVNDVHNCRTSSEGASATSAISRAEPSRVGFLVSEIPKFFDLNGTITAQQVVDAIKRYHGYEIAARQAQRALNQLQVRQRSGASNSATLYHDQTIEHPSNNAGVRGSNETNVWLQNQNFLPLAVSPTGALPPTNNMQENEHIIPQTTPTIPPRRSTGAAVPRASTSQMNTRSGGTRPVSRIQKQRANQNTNTQILFSEFKVEFTCTSCGATNTGVFPNMGRGTPNVHVPNMAPASSAKFNPNT